jgi:hypothetical protein
MEALGQAPKKETVQENRIPPPLPPPLPRAVPVQVRRPDPEPPVYIPRAEPEATSFTHITSHDEDLEKRFARFSSFDVQELSHAEKIPKVAVLTGSASHKNRWRQDLMSHSALRKAVVLNEILLPPVALR